MKQETGIWSEVLKTIRWDVFGTLTFSGRVPIVSQFRRRYADWLRGVEGAAHSYGCSRNFFLFGRPENGELTNRPHCHVMLARLSPLLARNFFVAEHLMARGIPSPALKLAHVCGFGFGEFRFMQKDDSGLNYLTLSGANLYERQKSFSCQQPIFNPPLSRFLRAEARRRLKGSNRDVEKSICTLSSTAICEPA